MVSVVQGEWCRVSVVKCDWCRVSVVLCDWCRVSVVVEDKGNYLGQVELFQFSQSLCHDDLHSCVLMGQTDRQTDRQTGQ